MARIRNPRSFSEHFKINPNRLDAMGIFNPVLNVDTKLFIDPVLLRGSRYAAISRRAEKSFNAYFVAVIKLLVASKRREDVAWKAAQSRLQFPEIAATCLGYGASGIRGSAFGPGLNARLIDTAKEIVDLGVTDPDLFKLLPLLEEGVGPDLISDLTTNVIEGSLAELTEEVCKTLKIPTEKFNVRGKDFKLPVNPTQVRRIPVLLVPNDILRALPVASCWSEVADAAAASAAARNRINQMIGNIWSARTRRDKDRLRATVLGSRSAFEALLLLIQTVAIRPYDIQGDPAGLTIWRKIHETIAQDFPLRLELGGPPTGEKAIKVVRTIINHFQHLVEKKGLWKVFWADRSPHNEKVAQMVFFVMADAYCKANNLDVTPEAETGSGPVDFKFSYGYNIRVLVEIKLSRNQKLISGYQRQLAAYNDSQEPLYAVYLILDVGRMGRKDQQLLDLKNACVAEGKPAGDIVFVDATPKASASKR